MKFRGKEISKKIVTLILVGLFAVGLAGATLVSYLSNAMTATVTVNPVGLTVGTSASLTGADPSGLGYDTSGIAQLTSPIINAGDSTGTTVQIANTGADIPADSSSVSLGLSYTSSAGYADPMNCINGVSQLDGSGTESCDVCDAAGLGGASPCIDGQEFEVIGISVWDGSNWQPNLGAVACVSPVYYWDTASSRCFWNFKSAVEASGTLPANPASVVSFPITSAIPSGTSFYGQILVKTATYPASFLQIASGDYSLSVSVIPTP